MSLDSCQKARKILLAVFCAISFLHVAGTYAYWRPKFVPNPGLHDAGEVQGDFSLRFHEAECARKGVDPYDVWSGARESDEYYPYNRPEKKSPTATKKINAYPPWEYAWMMPFTFLPVRNAWRLFDLAMVAGVVAIAIAAFRLGRRNRGDAFGGLFCAASALCVGFAVEGNFIYGNYGVFLAVACFGLALAESRGWTVLSGFCLAFLMSKPQVGTLFCLTLICNRRWRPVALAAAICLVSTLPVSLLLRKSPVELVLQIPKYGSDVLKETLLFPKPVFEAMSARIGYTPTMTLNAFVGAALCAILSLRCRNSRSWLKRLAPAVVCSTAWTYCIIHDRWIYALPNVAFALAFLSKRLSFHLRFASLAAILLNESTMALSIASRLFLLERKTGNACYGLIGGGVSNISSTIQVLNFWLMAVLIWFLANAPKRNHVFDERNEN